MPAKIVSLTLLDTCLPSYFQGCSAPHYAVPVDGETTAEELRESIETEYDGGCDDGVPDDSEGLKAALDSMFEGTTPETVIFSDLEPREAYEDGESVYAYFRVDIEESDDSEA